jgi:hypothetical protein
MLTKFKSNQSQRNMMNILPDGCDASAFHFTPFPALLGGGGGSKGVFFYFLTS